MKTIINISVIALLSAAGISCSDENSTAPLGAFSDSKTGLSIYGGVDATYLITSDGVSRGPNHNYTDVRATDRDKSQVQATSNALTVNNNGRVDLTISHPTHSLAVSEVISVPERNSIIFAFSIDGPTTPGTIQIVGENDCAIFEANLENSQVSCVTSGIYVDYDPNELVHGGATERHQISQNAMQYNDGELFVQGWEYEKQCYADGECEASPVGNGNSLLWRLTLSDNGEQATKNRISLLSEHVMTYFSTSSGSAVYKFSGGFSQYNPRLKAWNISYGVQSLTDTDVGNFIADDESTIFFTENHAGADIGVVTSQDVGVLKTRLNALKADKTGGDALLAVMAGDNGKLFAALSKTDPVSGSLIYNIRQVLPYVTPTLHTIEPTVSDTNKYFGGRGMIFSSGYLYYLETVEITDGTFSIGTSDVIRSVRLLDGNEESIFKYDWVNDKTAPRYSVKQWRKSGNKIVFSAVDQQANKPVLIKLDLSALRRGEEEFFTSTDMSSVIDASATVKKVEEPRVIEEVIYTGDTPVISNILVDSSNPHSLSLKFSTFMNTDDVDGAVYLQDQNGNEIPTIKAWLGRYLHLIPDTSQDGLGDTTYVPLESGISYTVGIDESKYVEALNGAELQFPNDNPNDLVLTISP